MKKELEGGFNGGLEPQPPWLHVGSSLVTLLHGLAKASEVEAKCKLGQEEPGTIVLEFHAVDKPTPNTQLLQTVLGEASAEGQGSQAGASVAWLAVFLPPEGPVAPGTVPGPGVGFKSIEC